VDVGIKSYSFTVDSGPQKRELYKPNVNLSARGLTKSSAFALFIASSVVIAFSPLLNIEVLTSLVVAASKQPH